MANIAKGFVRVGGNLAVSIRFDPETFEEIRNLATKHNRSFSDEVRILVEWGLETVKDD